MVRFADLREFCVNNVGVLMPVVNADPHLTKVNKTDLEGEGWGVSIPF